MTDTDKQTTDQPVADDKKVEEPKSDQTDSVQDAPVQDAPAQDTPAPASDGDQTAGSTDQHGRQLFDVTCSSCGNKAQVPFKPSGGRPVYCRDCYSNQRNDRAPRRQF